jgi:hypothetical protein
MTVTSSPPRAARRAPRRRSPPAFTSMTCSPCSCNGSGGIESVVNGTGTAVSPTNGGPSDVVSAS